MLKYFMLNEIMYTNLPESVLDGISVVVSVVGSKGRSVEELVKMYVRCKRILSYTIDGKI